MANTTKEKRRKHVATRISAEACEKIQRRVKRSKEPTNFAAVLRGIIEEHA